MMFFVSRIKNGYGPNIAVFYDDIIAIIESNFNSTAQKSMATLKMRGGDEIEIYEWFNDIVEKVKLEKVRAVLES